MHEGIGRPKGRWPWLQVGVLISGPGLWACGPLPDAQPYTGVVNAADGVPEIPASAPAYLINGGYGIHIPYDALGITTKKNAWSLTWFSQGTPQRISGDALCPPGCVVYAVTQNGVLGSSGQASGNRVTFDVRPYADTKGSLTFEVSRGPVAFKLSIDGKPVERGQVVFASGGQLATAPASPFRLITQ